MSAELLQLYVDTAGRPSRFRKPFKTIFFCGGEMLEPPLRGPPKSLRDYLCRTRAIKVGAKIVFAESANRLYRDTSYSDLISFEEDIARVASIVLVVSESPGSLAELGAFSMNDVIRPALRAISQSEYETSESFVRFGPIKKLLDESEDYVAFYPWEVNKRGRLIQRTASPHYMDMKQFISDSAKRMPETSLFDQDVSVKRLFVVYWALYLAYAASITVLLAAVRRIYPDMTMSDLRDVLFCLRVVGWVDREKYSNKEYYFSLGSSDPVEYKVSPNPMSVDLLVRRRRVRDDFEAAERLPKHITDTVKAKRAAAA